ncbi:MAG: carotenoid biosynthesis protein [Actinobacteria bacterium]|nr:carotenoid biosynthesis protein [Actinomycetota bacterium]
MKANVIVFETAILIFTIVFYQGAKLLMGKKRNLAFFLGAACFSLVIESIAVAGGAKNFYWYAANNYYSHYPPGGYIVWLGVVPLAYCLLWYIVSMTSYVIATAFLPRAKSYLSCLLAGGIAVVFYMIIEPVGVLNHWWTWNLKSFYMIDVPLAACISAFLSVFVFTWIYHVTVFEKRDIGALARIENNTFKRWPMKTRKLTRNLDWDDLQTVYFFRLGLGVLAYSAVIAPFMVLFWAIANRGHIVPGW